MHLLDWCPCFAAKFKRKTHDPKVTHLRVLPANGTCLEPDFSRDVDLRSLDKIYFKKKRRMSDPLPFSMGQNSTLPNNQHWSCSVFSTTSPNFGVVSSFWAVQSPYSCQVAPTSPTQYITMEWGKYGKIMIADSPLELGASLFQTGSYGFHPNLTSK